MKKISDIIFLTSENHRLPNIESCFHEDYLLIIEDFFRDKKRLYPNHEEDSAYDFFCKKIEERGAELRGVVINYQLDGKNCFSIAHHLRLFDFNEKELNKLPIIIVHHEELALSKDAYSGINDFGLFKNRAIFFGLMDELMNKDNLSGNIHIYDLINKFNEYFNYKEYIEKLQIPAPRTTSRHQIANEWGSLRLARNAGYSKNDIEYNYPPTLYFKYLNKKFRLDKINSETLKEIAGDYIVNEKLIFSKHPFFQNNKILLIDDNADKGWESTLKLIFGNIDVETDFEKINQFGDLKNLSSYELIFLDLRLPKIQLENIKPDFGYKLLKNIKKEYPGIPVIIFTASNKSWTLDEVSELGADGMYVKESPEYAGDSEYTEGNFKSFVHVVLNTLEKYKILNPYWNAIQTILINPTFKSIREKSSSKIKERIEERLKMFYGLLKQSFEQTRFNYENFHFSDYELAFITLWSILNEISEAFYKKTQPHCCAIDKAENKQNYHPNGRNISYLKILNGLNHYKWTIRDEAEVFIEYEYKVKYVNGKPITNKYRYYKLKGKQKSIFEYRNNQFSTGEPIETEIDYTKVLYMQIAFLLEKKNNLSGSSKKSCFQSKLVSLNDTRNHLYLTHGSEISEGFYDKTEKEKRSHHNIKPDRDIKDLFELIAFLLTGNLLEVKL